MSKMIHKSLLTMCVEKGKFNGFTSDFYMNEKEVNPRYLRLLLEQIAVLMAEITCDLMNALKRKPKKLSENCIIIQIGYDDEDTFETRVNVSLLSKLDRSQLHSVYEAIESLRLDMIRQFVFLKEDNKDGCIFRIMGTIKEPLKKV